MYVSNGKAIKTVLIIFTDNFYFTHFFYYYIHYYNTIFVFVSTMYIVSRVTSKE